MKVGIVTGASSGIGREFAVQIQKEYDLDEIWLIARSEDKLAETSAALKQAKGIIIPLNLSSGKELETLKSKISTEKPEISVLVNSAGYGHEGVFGEVDLDLYMDMIDLNIKALVQLTYLCLPYMNKGSVIFQLGSISAFLPSPKVAVYGASKAFVYSFSLALNQELKTKGIHVIAVSPGPVATNFLKVATDGAQDAYANSAQPYDVVRLAINDVKKRQLNSTYGLAPKINVMLSKILSKKMVFRLVSR